ncbi:brachyurin-like isoform X1 [Rhynchophorus ferrugineus]|uniref:brachyurin-like isoform X1 n=2 Tax=Rhynchophorus ferrugineus TaxID=354439 RepID=UPI003FCCFA4D
MLEIILPYILIGVLSAISFSQAVIDVTPDHFPFQALVQGNLGGQAGALISKKHVITLAVDLNVSEMVTVYLGFLGHPLFEKYRNEGQGQIITSKKIIIHSRYMNISDKYINNVAIIVLSHPVQLSSSVQPIDLSSVPPLPGLHPNISGWVAGDDSRLKYNSLILHDVDTCIYLYGTEFLQTQELCYEEYPSSGLNLVGNPITINNKLIGLLTFSENCVKHQSYCSDFFLIINLFPFITWIHTQIGVGVKSHDTSSPNILDLQKPDDLIEENKRQLSDIKVLQNTTLKTINKLSKKSNEMERAIEKILAAQISDRKENKDIISNIKKINETVHNLLQRLTSTTISPEET